jgi:hypothetical protein
MAFAPTYAGVGDNKRDVYGATEVGIWSITFSGADTYVTGGLALTSATFGLSRPILAVEVLATNTAAGVWYWAFNNQTGKLQMYGTGGGVAGTAAFAEASNATSIANFAIAVIVYTQR